MLSNAQGIPLAVAVSGANMPDDLALKRSSATYLPLGPAGDHGGAAPSNSARTRRTSPPNTWPGCARGLVARIARPGIESGERLGRHRWKIERSIAWLFGYRRLTVRKGSHFLALAAALTCWKKLAKLAT